MSETYKKIILARRAKRLNIAPPQQAQLKGLALVKLLLTVTLARPLHMLFTEPTVFLFVSNKHVTPIVAEIIC